MKQITSKQFIILAFVIMIAQKMFMLPALVIKISGRDGYLSIAAFILIELFALVLIMLAAKNRTKFYTALSGTLTKIGGKIIVFLSLGYLFFKLMLLFGDIRVFFNSTLSETLTDWLALIPLCFLLFLVGTKTLRGIGRLAEILIFFILASVVALILLIALNLDFSLLKPVLENGFSPIFKSVGVFPMWFGDLSLLLIALGDIEFDKRGEKTPLSGKHFVKFGLGAAVIGGLIVLFFSSALFAHYGSMPELIDYSHNVSNMLLYSSSSYIYGRFDVPIFCIWIFSVFIEMCLVFYSLTRHASYIFGYKNNKITSLVLIAAAYLTFVFAFKSDYTLINASYSWIRVFAVFNVIFLPILLFFCTFRQKKREIRLIHIKEQP